MGKWGQSTRTWVALPSWHPGQRSADKAVLILPRKWSGRRRVPRAPSCPLSPGRPSEGRLCLLRPQLGWSPQTVCGVVLPWGPVRHGLGLCWACGFPCVRGGNRSPPPLLLPPALGIATYPQSRCPLPRQTGQAAPTELLTWGHVLSGACGRVIPRPVLAEVPRLVGLAAGQLRPHSCVLPGKSK